MFREINVMGWRPRPELNWCTRFCRPLRNHSATWPHETDLLQIIKGLSNLLRLVRRQFLKCNPMSLLKWLAPRLLTGRYDHQSSTALGVGTISQAHELIGRDKLTEESPAACRTFLEAGLSGDLGGRGRNQLK